MRIEKIWDELYIFWKQIDNQTLKINAKSSEDIVKLEQILNIELPIEFKTSLSYVCHSARNKMDDSWFGNYIETNFLTINEIEEEYQECINVIDEVENIYTGDILTYDREDWSKYWIPILTRMDIDIIIFIDLRENIGKQYGQILLYQPNIEIEDGHWVNHISYIASSYTQFMEQMLTEIKSTKGIKEKYFAQFLYRAIQKEDSSIVIVKNMILSWFSNRDSKAGDIINNNELTEFILLKLTEEQEIIFDDAIEELIESNLIQITDEDLISITDKGLTY